MDYVSKFVQSTNWKLDTNARMISAILDVLTSEQVIAINSKISTEISRQANATAIQSQYATSAYVNLCLTLMFLGFIMSAIGLSSYQCQGLLHLGPLTAIIGTLMIYAMIAQEIGIQF